MVREGPASGEPEPSVRLAEPADLPAFLPLYLALSRFN